TAFDANALIHETAALLRTDLDAPGIALELRLATKLPPVRGHHGQLQQVLLNLAANAADAMRGVTGRRRVLAITSQRVGSEAIAISVADRGTGIDPDDLERVFDPFFTTKSRGMGMGLALCRLIVETHGGTLDVSPARPHGSVFRIALPCSRIAARRGEQG